VTTWSTTVKFIVAVPVPPSSLIGPKLKESAKAVPENPSDQIKIPAITALQDFPGILFILAPQKN
jgi:hypothetical protein